MTKGVRIAVIGRTGCGAYGHQLDIGFAKHPRADIVAVADPDASGLQNARERLGARRAYANYRDMLLHERPEVVIVAPRFTNVHYEMVRASLESGAHVYCEKPFAISLDQADALLNLAQQRGLTIGVALPFVHEKRFPQLVDAVTSLGRVVSMRAICKCDHRGGGQDFAILGPHFADMMRRLAGDPFTIYARVTKDGKPISRLDIEQGGEGVGPVAGDSITAVYSFSGGVAGSIESHRLNIVNRDDQPYRLEIYCERGAVVVRAPYADHSMYVCEKPFGAMRAPWTRLLTEPVETYGDYHRLAAEDFIQAIESGRPPACSGYDGRFALEMMLGAYASALINSPVELPLVERRHPLAMARADMT